MTISTKVLDELLEGCERPEDLLGDTGLMKELKVKLMERMLGAELTEHLGYEDGQKVPSGQSNRRNGTSSKVLKGQDGELPLAVPRDRDGSFQPELVKKGQTRIDGIDDRIIGLYAAGLSVRDIRSHLEELYGLKVSGDLISRVKASKDAKIAISMDGKGAWRDNVFVERLWRTIKYEEVYLRAYASISEARASIGRYLGFYNGRRPHSSLGEQTPDQAYLNALTPIPAAA